MRKIKAAEADTTAPVDDMAHIKTTTTDKRRQTMPASSRRCPIARVNRAP